LDHDHQLALAREAVALAGRDISVSTSLQPPRFERRTEHGTIRLCCWGQYATTPSSAAGEHARKWCRDIGNSVR
jgi:hypothetical protein